MQNSCFVWSRFCLGKALTLHKFFRLEFEVTKQRRRSCLEKRQSKPKLLPEQQLVPWLFFDSEYDMEVSPVRLSRQAIGWFFRALAKLPQRRVPRTEALHRWTVELEETNTMLAREIAERKRMEKELRQAEAKYRSIFEHAVEGSSKRHPMDTTSVSIQPWHEFMATRLPKN